MEITATQLSKRYGSKTAVNDVTFTVSPGRVTGFLGPNGAGKSTTMRLILGLDKPTGGQVRIDGKNLADYPNPLQVAGSLLDAKAYHPGRSAYKHLLAQAHTHGISKRRVHEVIELTGLSSVAGKRAGGFSLGMGQRLGIANALLADPQILILDEPVNGLDPEGVRWVRQLVRNLAAEGRTVFLSSHLMSEMAQTADHIIVIGKGRILADAPVSEVVASASGVATRVSSPDIKALLGHLQVLGGESQLASTSTPQTRIITGVDSTQIAQTAFEQRILITELTPIQTSLEEAYMSLTADAVEYHTGVAGAQGVSA